MLVLSLIFVLLLTSCTGRLAYIIFSGGFTVSDTYNSYTLTLDRADVNLYYSDFTRITNNKFRLVAVIRPSEKDIKECMRLFSGEKLSSILDTLKENKPAVIEVENSFSSKTINTYYVRKSEIDCYQLIAKESSGLLMHIKAPNRKLEVNFGVDAYGRFLSGDKGSLKSTDYYLTDGIKLTLDKKLQLIAEKSCESMEAGCVVIMRVKDSSIAACVTKPLDSIINKCISQYAVGSVFKIVTAAVALEKGVDLSYNCQGKIKVGDTVFECQHSKAHGKQNLKEALANSCNCYFINLSLHLSKKELLKCAKSFGFDSSTKLYNGWNIKNGNLPSVAEINTVGEKALFSFGQGKLTASPVQICNMMCTVANGGIKNEIKLVEGELDSDMTLTPYITAESEKAVKSDTANKLIKHLRYAVEVGTGKAADYKNKVAGKTATAQTGQYKAGKELLNTWFAGVYPYDKPEYAIVIMCENGESGAKNCCPIFSTVIESIDTM